MKNKLIVVSLFFVAALFLFFWRDGVGGPLWSDLGETATSFLVFFGPWVLFALVYFTEKSQKILIYYLLFTLLLVLLTTGFFLYAERWFGFLPGIFEFMILFVFWIPWALISVGLLILYFVRTLWGRIKSEHQ